MTEGQRERDDAITAAVQDGASQADAARAAGITRQRVGQILAGTVAERPGENLEAGPADGELEEIRAVSDPLERARRATELIDGATDLIGAASAIRQEALEYLRDTMTPGGIARGAGMTRARISRLLESAPARGGQAVPQHDQEG